MSMRARILGLVTGIAALVLTLAAIPMALLWRDNAYDQAGRSAQVAAQNVTDYCRNDRCDDATLSEFLNRINERGAEQIAVITSNAVLGADLPDEIRNRPDPGPQDDSFEPGDGPNRAPDARVMPVMNGRLAFAHATINGEQAQVLAFISDDVVAEEIRNGYLVIAAAVIGLTLLAALAAEITSRRLVRPLDRTANTALRLSTGDLMARATVDGPPEVARVAIELNALADRIDELLVQEREMAADLAHRIRTPLTAVRLGIEGLPEGERKDELENNVANLERSLTQVIRAARRPNREGVHPATDATAVLRERLSFWQPLAEDQNREAHADLPSGEILMRASVEDFSVVIDALIENVFAHTSEGTDFGIVLRRDDDHCVVEVWDNGPGIPTEALARGRSDRGSSGLGLDIAQSFAVNTGGSIEIFTDNDRHGVRMRLREADSQSALASI